MKTSKIKLAGILLLACVFAFAGKSHRVLPISVYEINGPSGYMAGHIIDTRLPDGTRCIIHYVGGITCDFSKKPE